MHLLSVCGLDGVQHTHKTAGAGSPQAGLLLARAARHGSITMCIDQHASCDAVTHAVFGVRMPAMSDVDGQWVQGLPNINPLL
jgi:hypothetical protein